MLLRGFGGRGVGKRESIEILVGWVDGGRGGGGGGGGVGRNLGGGV